MLRRMGSHGECGCKHTCLCCDHELFLLPCYSSQAHTRLNCTTQAFFDDQSQHLYHPFLLTLTHTHSHTHAAQIRQVGLPLWSRCLQHICALLIYLNVCIIIIIILSLSTCYRYGKWGYRFGRGAFNILRDEYEQAVSDVQHAPLESVIHDFQGVDEVRQALCLKCVAYLWIDISTTAKRLTFFIFI